MNDVLTAVPPIVETASGPSRCRRSEPARDAASISQPPAAMQQVACCPHRLRYLNQEVFRTADGGPIHRARGIDHGAPRGGVAQPANGWTTSGRADPRADKSPAALDCRN